jgi:hypothetical protein
MGAHGSKTVFELERGVHEGYIKHNGSLMHPTILSEGWQNHPVGRMNSLSSNCLQSQGILQAIVP